jgi:hypothetical protein
MYMYVLTRPPQCFGVAGGVRELEAKNKMELVASTKLDVKDVRVREGGGGRGGGGGEREREKTYRQRSPLRSAAC